jgi:hypothetical protein
MGMGFVDARGMEVKECSLDRVRKSSKEGN